MDLKKMAGIYVQSIVFRVIEINRDMSMYLPYNQCETWEKRLLGSDPDRI